MCRAEPIDIGNIDDDPVNAAWTRRVNDYYAACHPEEGDDVADVDEQGE